MGSNETLVDPSERLPPYIKGSVREKLEEHYSREFEVSEPDFPHQDEITYDDCGWMRVKARNGAKLETLAVLYDTDIQVVKKHILGECSHEDGILPLDEQH